MTHCIGNMESVAASMLHTIANVLEARHSLTAFACLQGTNRPPRINVLVDDNNLGPVRTAVL